MKLFTIECPDALVESLDRFVRKGDIADEQQAVVEALRRFIDSHQPELIESQIRSDIEWDLHGQE